MIGRSLTAGLLACIGLTSTGCDTILNKRYSLFNDRAQTMGANQLIEPDTFEEIYLPALLDPGKHRSPDGKTDEQIGAEIDQAFARFRKDYGNNSQAYSLARNSVQDRIVGSSVQRCNFYKLYLRRVDQSLNLALGSLATVAGGVGAIVTGVDAARALAGTAGIFSGLRAEANEDLFAGLALQVITDGIDTRRARMLDAIRDRRKKAASQPSDYTVEAAVADALLYHGACSLVDGLKEAGAAINRVRNPGLEEFRRVNRALLGDRLLEQEGQVLVQAGIVGMIAEAETVRAGIEGEAMALKTLFEQRNVPEGQQNAIDGIVTKFTSAYDPILNDAENGLLKKHDEAKARDTAIAEAATALARKQAAGEPSDAEQETLRAKQAEGRSLLAAAQLLLNKIHQAAEKARNNLQTLKLNALPEEEGGVTGTAGAGG